MDWGGLLPTAVAVITVATGVILIAGKMRIPLRRWLFGSDITPSEVLKHLNDLREWLQEHFDQSIANQITITDNQGILLEVVSSFAGDEDPTPEQVMEALQTLAAAGFALGDEDEEDEPGS